MSAPRYVITDHRGARFAVADLLDEASARVIARKLSRFRPDAGSGGPALSARPETVDLFEILRIADPGDLDVNRLWAPTRSGPPFEKNPWGKDWTRIPIGVDENGATVVVDFKETHEGGMGNAMVLVGTTGSGKSEFFTTLILSACMTHSPESLNIAFFDFKGSTTAHAIAGLPHMVATMNNLRNDSLWIDRMGDVIYGDLERRKQMLDRARVGSAAEYEYRRIHGGERLAPMPNLLVIIDEFTQMFIQHPPAKAVIDEIGRQGRALGVRLIMGSQRMGHEMATGVMANIPIRGALRTVDEEDSRAVIKTGEAKYLPDDPAGAGLLLVAGKPRLIRFQTAYVSKDYIPPRRAAAEAVRAQVGYVPPRVFSASGMEPVAQPVVATGSVEPPAPTRVIGPDGRAVRQIQAATASLRSQVSEPVRPMWLPPLEPLPVDELIKRLRGRPWYENYGDNKGLRFPVGVEDRPFQHAQRVYAPDLSGSNCPVIGMADAGKTTALATMITGAALMYTPHRVQFYVIALSGPVLNATAELPHVGMLARASEPERVGRTIAEMTTLVNERETAFARLGLTITEFRARKFDGHPGEVPDDPFGDVFLVIDNWAQFHASFERYVADVEFILRKGPAYGVHVIVSASGWISGRLTSAMTPELSGPNVELKLGANDDLNRNSLTIAKQVPFGDREIYEEDDEDADADAPRGEDSETRIIQVRGRGTSNRKYHFQAALPQVTGPDGQVLAAAAAAAMVAQVAGTSSAATIRVLPGSVSAEEVNRLWDSRGGGTAGQVPFGISEVGLLPAVADFTASPHLLLVGDPECGKSPALATLAQGVMRAYSPAEAQIYLVDPKNSLLQVVEGDHLGAYTFREQQVRDMAGQLAAVLETRLPPEDVSQAELAAAAGWSGAHIFVFVDDEHMVQAWDRGGWQPGTGYPLEPLLPFADRGKEIGLHFVVSRRIGQWGRALGSPLPGKLLQLKVPGVVMDGDRGEGKIMDEVMALRQPPGRGIYVTDKVSAPVQIAWPSGRR
jgi:type VII secretion protein EccCb